MDRTNEEIERRIQGIVASSSFEGLESTPEDIAMLRKLAHGEITEEDYLKFYEIE